MGTGYDYSWFILTQSIIKKEFALSGSEQNPDLTGKSWRMTIKRATNKGAPAPVEAFKENGADFIVRDNPGRSGQRMNALSGDICSSSITSRRRSRHATARSQTPTSRTRR
jgi:predicted oxidoreductase